MAMLGPFNSAVVNPSLVILSKAMHVDSVTGAYNTTTAIIVGGVIAFLLMPLSNVYGRRPVALFCLFLATMGSIGSALSPDFSALIGTRVICGMGMSCMMSVGTAVLNDMFFLHERGFKTGIWTVFLTNGAHTAVICKFLIMFIHCAIADHLLVGGFLGQKAGWQWDFWFPAICDGTLLLVCIFFLPETLFSRHPNFLNNRKSERTWWQMLFDFKSNLIPERKFKFSNFSHPFIMAKYPSILFPAIFYTMAWTFINTLPAVTIATTYTATYKLAPGVIGACLGSSLIIGSVLAELVTGKITDIILYHNAKKNDGVPKLEARLYLTIIAAIMMPIGLIIYGFGIQKKYSFYVPLVGLGIGMFYPSLLILIVLLLLQNTNIKLPTGAFGIQMESTCLYAYVSDCYRPQTMESAVLFNLGRGIAFVVGFFAIPFAKHSGYGWAWFTFAMLMIISFVPVALLFRYGEHWRKRMGEPSFDKYI